VFRVLRDKMSELPIAVLMARKNKKDQRGFSYEGKITWLTFCRGCACKSPLRLRSFGSAITPRKVQWTLTILIVGCMACILFGATREHAVSSIAKPFLNLLAAITGGRLLHSCEGPLVKALRWAKSCSK